LFAPAVSDDEDGMSNHASNSPAPSVAFDENHPGTQVAVAAAAIDSALQAVATAVIPTLITSSTVTTTTTTNKRSYDQVVPAAPAVQLKRRVTLDGTKRITLSSSCGSLKNLPTATVPTSVVSPPTSPISVAEPAVFPSNSDVEGAPKMPTPKTPNVAKKSSKKTTKVTASGTVRQGVDPVEKAKACRERNREHARKTRIRKKAYVDELKQALNDMVEERDAKKAMEEQKATIVEQNRDVRFQVMQDFMNLRGNNERSPDRWAAILVPEKFKLKLPATDFQTMVQPPVDSPAPIPGQQFLAGIQDIMADASFFSAFLQTITNNSDDAATEAASPIYFSYNCQRDSFLMDGCHTIFNFDGTSCGAVHQGASSELIMSGTFRATFCPETNRLCSAELMFDTGAIRFQLQHMQKARKLEPFSN
jgi:hypothetical protein